MSSNEKTSQDNKTQSQQLNDDAVRKHMQGDFESAVAIYQQALAVDPRNANAHNNVAFVLAQQGEYADAKRHAQKACALKPQNAQYQNTYAQVLMATGEAQKSLQRARRATELAPESVDHWDNLARLALLAGEFTQVARACEQAEGIAGPSPERSTRRATAVCMQERYLDASRELLSVVASWPDYAPAWAQLGVTLFLQQDLASAKDALQKALGIDRKNALALRHLGLIQASQGAVNAAIRTLAECLEVTPSDRELAIDLAVLLLADQQHEAACSLLQDVLEYEEDERARFYYAIVKKQVGELKVANQMLRELAQSRGPFATQAEEMLAA